MQGLSSRQGQLRWKQSCGKVRFWKFKNKTTTTTTEKKGKLPAYWPSVPLCVPFSYTELHYLQEPQGGSVARSESNYRSLQRNHMETNNSGNLTVTSGGVLLWSNQGVGVKHSSVVTLGLGRREEENGVGIVQ